MSVCLCVCLFEVRGEWVTARMCVFLIESGACVCLCVCVCVQARLQSMRIAGRSLSIDLDLGDAYLRWIWNKSWSLLSFTYYEKFGTQVCNTTATTTTTTIVISGEYC